MFRLGATMLALGLAALWVTACGGRSTGSASVAESTANVAATEAVGTVPAYNTTRMSIATAKPVDAYVLLGGRIKSCWFNPSAPLFPEHVYRADVSPDGQKVKITIHDKRNLGRAGKLAYSIDFAQQGSQTAVTSRNLTMTPQQAAKMQFDVNRWKSGQKDCSKKWPKVAG
ncbi:MAG: hypothetical protein ACN4EH_05440 [Methyloceanibacter sp.]|uniref:hypothetical protein n=1 Tax=Methyloceanibacter sp. TaxID=1965321 RepID=UPI003565554A